MAENAVSDTMDQIAQLRAQIERQALENAQLVHELREIRAARVVDQERFQSALRLEQAKHVAALDQEAQLFQDLLDNAHTRYNLLLCEKEELAERYVQLENYLCELGSKPSPETQLHPEICREVDERKPLEDQILELGPYLSCLDCRKTTPPPLMRLCTSAAEYSRQFLSYIKEDIRSEIAEELRLLTGASTLSHNAKQPVSSFAQYPHDYSTEDPSQYRQIVLLTPRPSMPKLDHGFSRELICIRLPRGARLGPQTGDQFVLGIASLRNVDEREYSIDDILGSGDVPGSGDDGMHRARVDTVEINVTLLRGAYATLSGASQLRWYHVCGLVPAVRRYEACQSAIQPAFMTSVIQRSAPRWPLEPPADHTRQQHLACLNAQQRSVVNRICTTTDSGIYSLIGPPGTGKTSTIVQLLAERVRCFPQQKILLTAPSNKAVNVALELFMRTISSPPLVAYVGVSQQLARTEVCVAELDRHLTQPYVAALAAKASKPEQWLRTLAAAHVEALTRLRDLILRPGLPVEAHIRAAILALLTDMSSYATAAESIRGFEEGDRHIRAVVDRIQTDSYLLEQYMLQKAHIVFATLVASGRSSLFKTVQHFDCVVVDEAAQALIPETFIPFKFDPSLCLLIGDPQQLPGLVHSGELRSLGYAESLMGVLTEGRQRPHLERLSTQYRMHPSICKWISDRFYDGELVADAGLVHRPSPLTGLPASMPLRVLPSAFIDCDFKENKGKHGEISNAKEAGVVMEAVKQLLRHGVAAERIGVITFYAAQVQVLCDLRGRLAKELPQAKDLAAKLTISTVDGFQGDERDFILISCVRTVPSVGFLSDHRRINVALSRAKHARWVFGCATALRSSKSVFQSYFNWLDNVKENCAEPATQLVSCSAL